MPKVIIFKFEKEKMLSYLEQGIFTEDEADELSEETIRWYSGQGFNYVCLDQEQIKLFKEEDL